MTHGIWGALSSSGRPSSKATYRPTPPGKPYLIPGSTYEDPDVITIGWDPPIILGGSRLIGYVVEHKRTGSPYWVKAMPVVARHNQLSLSGLEPGMRYQFRVTAENAYGRSEPSPLSEPFMISYSRGGVAVAPVFSAGLTDTSAIENEKVEFLVKVEGTPTPKISWFKDGFEVFSNRRQKVSTDGDLSIFTIHQTALSDEGEIKCTATNKAGHAVTKGRLSLEAPPSIRLQRQYEDGLIFELGEVVRLKVAVSGRPQPEVTWYHDGEVLKPDGRVEIALTDKHALVKVADATRADRGEYQVKAKNSIGDDAASFLVTITDRPLPPEKVEVVMTLGRCVTLGWMKPKDDGGCMIGNYIVEYYRIGWNMWLKAATCRQLQTTIGDLIEGSEYKFRVKAENPYGISDPSDESVTVFIPDPKRGLLEPPPKGSPLAEEMPDEWMERSEHKSKATKSDKLGEWTEDESLPSQVVLAQQVLRKVKMAPQRTLSEESQGSPPREVSKVRGPVPPKRKHRPPTLHETSVSPVNPPKKERKLPPHLQKEFDRIYSQMGDREPSPESMAVGRRLRAMTKLSMDDEEADSERMSRKIELTKRGPMAPKRKASKSPRRSQQERESRTPSIVREITPRASISPEPFSTSSSKLNKDTEQIKADAQRLKKEEELKRKEEELIKKMEELKRREEELMREERRREQEEEDKRRKLAERRDREEREMEEAERRGRPIEWGRELSHDIHSSSEMMLVLFPNNDLAADDEGRMTAEELKESPLIAPPMSLSAPVIGGSDPSPPVLRGAVSSTEIMYELAMARLNKEADEDEAEESLKVRYGLDRKRSFEKKDKRPRFQFKDSTASLDNLSVIDEDLDRRDEEATAPESPDNQVDRTNVELFSERFMHLERSFEKYNQQFEFEDSKLSDAGSDVNQSFDYYDEVEEEETYHPRVAKGVFTPMAVQYPTREFAERVPSPTGLPPPPLITISEEPEKDVELVKLPETMLDFHDSPSFKRVIVSEAISERLEESPEKPVRRSPSPNKISSPSTPEPPVTHQLLPKPILKTRDRSAERSDASDSESTSKRVRIEEPNDKKNIDMYAKEENDMGLQAGEVARNRRKQPRPAVEEPVVVNIYSDIIREFSQMRKPQPKIYLSYEELKEAAEKTLGPSSDDLDVIAAAAEKEQTKQELSDQNKLKPESPKENSPAKPVPCQLPRSRKLYMEYLLDLFLFFVALWLYLFNDPRLTIPILTLMIYRQLKETMQTKLSSFKWFRRKEE